MAMRKSEFIDKVARKAEMSRDAAARAVEAIFDTAKGTLAESIRSNGHVSLPGFGRFRAKTRAARRGRNPQTGALIEIPERNVIQFTPGPALQRVLEEPDFTPPRKRSGARKTAARGNGGSEGSGAKGAARKGGARKSTS
jgi:DNA-binding protein HU-beta